MRTISLTHMQARTILDALNFYHEEKMLSVENLTAISAAVDAEPTCSECDEPLKECACANPNCERYDNILFGESEDDDA